MNTSINYQQLPLKPGLAYTHRRKGLSNVHKRRPQSGGF